MKRRKKRFGKIVLYLLGVFILAFIAFGIYFKIDTKITPPEMKDMSALNEKRDTLGPDYYKIGNNWLRKNKYGLWEMYLEGSPFEMGVANGKLTKELLAKQEDAFVKQIKEMIPSPFYLKFLRYFIAWFNRDIDEYIIPEYQKEIYGISFSASDKYDYIGSNYERMLNYHAAHDIGHALKDLALVGCTSFAANLGFQDSSMIIGRNFDFYINDEFAEDKIMVFVNPEKGHKFAYITWASMIGVVSGMNEEGLTVTINAGKSEIPTKAATPISLLAREILQYAGNFDEAIAIARKRKIFVSESLLIGSAEDNNAIIIEKSPSRMDVVSVKNNFLVCSNHFQGELFANDPENMKYISESPSLYREERATQLIESDDTLNYLEAAAILRDRNGLNGESIGIGNEKAMAQMISHHSVIFMPLKRQMWVSTHPYQLGEYLEYNLNKVFSMSWNVPLQHGVYDSAFTIPADPFLNSKAFTDFMMFRQQKHQIEKAIDKDIPLDNEDRFIENFVSLDPDYYLGYKLAGDYYYNFGLLKKAVKYYKLSLTKEFENTIARQHVEEKLNSAIRILKSGEKQ